MEVKSPTLLRTGERLHPIRCTATLNLTPLSVATMTLPEDGPGPGIRDWIALEGPEGPLGIYRVASATATGGQRQLSLEHGAATLEDDLLPAGAVLSGDLRGMLTALLGHQSAPRWALGEVEISGALPALEAGGRSLLQALLDALALDDTAMPVFDQSAEPWRVHVRRKPDAPACECRLNRNLQGVSVTVSDAELCTRAVTEAGSFDSDSVGTWGVVARSVIADSEAGARRYLAAHGEPGVSVAVDALQLAALTGEPLDRFALGQLCRVALPDWGVTVTERVVSVAYPDLLGDPTRVRLTLSNARPDASLRLARLRSEAVRAAWKTDADLKKADKALREKVDQTEKSLREELADDRAANEQVAREIVTRVERNETNLDLHRTHLDAIDGTLNTVGIDLDAVHATITLHAEHFDLLDGSMNQALLELDGHNARITAQAQRLDEAGQRISGAEIILDGLQADILLKADKKDVDDKLNQAYLDIDGANARITAAAEQLDAQGRRLSGAELDINGLEASIIAQTSRLDEFGQWVSSQITIQSGMIESKVSAGDIASTINQTPQSVRIQAGKIDLDGYVTMKEFSALKGEVGDMWSGVLEASTIQTQQLVATNTVRLLGHTCQWDSARVVTSVNSPTFNYVTLHYKDHDGNNKSQVVLTSVNTAASGNTATLNYMTYP